MHAELNNGFDTRRRNYKCRTPYTPIIGAEKVREMLLNGSGSHAQLSYVPDPLRPWPLTDFTLLYTI